MKALRVHKNESGISTQLENVERTAIQNGEVLIQNQFSSLNYKDALGVAGRSPIFKRFPITPGIDVAGTVAESKSPRFNVGDPVLVTGGGLGETHDGGYAEYTVENEQNIIFVPNSLTLREAMIYGTAGFTAALCLERLLLNGQTPSLGPILVTGASGGVGQFAISFLTRAGFDIHALTGKPELADQLLALGAKKVLHFEDLKLSAAPLGPVTYGGAIDNLGGEILAKIMAHTALWGNVACVGLAASAELKTTVMPLILRGVSLIGISSNNTPMPLRQKIWQRLATDLKPSDLQNFCKNEIHLDEVLTMSHKMLNRQTQGRTLVRL